MPYPLRNCTQFHTKSPIFRGPKETGQTIIIVNTRIVFSGTNGVCFSEIPCRAFSAAALSCCLFENLIAFSCVFSSWKEYTTGLKSGPLNNIPFPCLEKILGCFHSMFWVITHLPCENHPIWKEFFSHPH